MWISLKPSASTVFKKIYVPVGRLGVLTHYCQVGFEVQVSYLASINTPLAGQGWNAQLLLLT